MDVHSQKLIRVRLARIEGQVRGLMNMIETDRDSREVLVQLSALRAALNSVGTLLISEHVENLVGGKGTSPELNQMLKSMLETFLAPPTLPLP